MDLPPPITSSPLSTLPLQFGYPIFSAASRWAWV